MESAEKLHNEIKEPLTLATDQPNVSDDSKRDERHSMDPYFYTQGKEFTSEIFKIELLNLPNYVAYTQLKKFLGGKLQLKPHKIKLFGQTPPTVFITFRCEEDRESALNTLNGYQWRGRTITAKKANPSADPLVKKRKKEASILDVDDGPNPKVSKTKDDNQSVDLRLKEALAPLWDIAYPEQLRQKQQSIREILIRFGRQLQKTNVQIAFWLQQQRDENGGLCCRLLVIRPSPVENAYRNKCEFSLGLHPETSKKTVGFRMGSYKSGSKCVVPPTGLPNLPSAMVLAAECFEAYVGESRWDVFNPETNEGHWRLLTVRTTSCNSHLMLIVGMHPQDLTEEDLAKERDQLKEYFGPGGPGARCYPTSLYFQPMRRKVPENEAPPPELLWGQERIEESLLGMNFLVSPNAFFQVNTRGAEVLYETIAEMARVDAETVVIDLCCGTGVIGISLASKVQKVVGIEMCEQAVEDARSNAQRNGISNAEFVCGKAEEALYDVLRRLEGSTSIIAIVDPPRAGLHSKVIKCIRGADSLCQLIYVSCNPQVAVNNFVDLCRPMSNSYRGDPFLPRAALPVDLFPHTRHCELVVLFQR